MASDDNKEFAYFLQLHSEQLKSSGVPEIYWSSLLCKLKDEVFDAGETFMMVRDERKDSGIEDCEQSTHLKVVVSCEEGLDASDENSIFLIDHAWTYRIDTALKQLLEIPKLLERMSSLMNCETDVKLLEESPVYREQLALQVMNNMWKFNQNYNVGNEDASAEFKQPVWYVMDEFGSCIKHSDEPSCRLIPFIYSPTQMPFSLIWPLKDLEYAEEVTRDYAVGIMDSVQRSIRLLPWKHTDLTHIPVQNKEPDPSFYRKVNSETLPDVQVDPPRLPSDRQLRVFTNVTVVTHSLDHPQFQLVPTEEGADILWYYNHFKKFKELSEENPNCFVNQFPGESMLTLKDMLPLVARRATATGDYPKWLPVTFNLATELPEFVSYFQKKAAEGKTNVWICKPWNLARGLDTYVTSDLSCITRITETHVPKVACRYIHDPVLFDREEVGRAKMDLRYIVLLQSVRPLKLFAYDVFWLRFANKPFSLDNFFDYQKHFTVMNYFDEGERLYQVHHDQFIPQFERQYPDHPWEQVRERVFQNFRELFQAVVSQPYPQGLAHSPQSRAMYAIDFMLEWQTDEKGDKYMQPLLLEVNFNADCDRAVKYHPHFFNDIFSTLFLNEHKNVTQIL